VFAEYRLFRHADTLGGTVPSKYWCSAAMPRYACDRHGRGGAIGPMTSGCGGGSVRCAFSGWTALPEQGVPTRPGDCGIMRSFDCLGAHMKVAILSGSVYGTAEDVARHAERQLKAAGFETWHDPRAQLPQILEFAPEALLVV